MSEQERNGMVNVLRVDLSARTTRTETLSDEFVHDYVGAKGIGSHMLLEETAPGIDPLSPEAKMIFSAGPLSGSSMPGTDRYAVYFLSPQTGGYGEAYSGGKVATQFARTGHRVVVLEGKATSPVFVEVSDEMVKIHAAEEFWGLDCYEAEERLLERVGVKHAQACVIGPAGEKLVRFACIQNNRTHSLGRGGCGAVMGSKNVKGLVFHGTTKPQVARPDELKTLVREMIEKGKDHPAVAAYNAKGTVQMVRVTNGVSMFPTRYWTAGHLDDFEPLSAETMMEKYKVANSTCPPCFIACGHVCRVPDGELAGLEIDGPEYETIFAFGGLCEVVDFAYVMLYNDICDRQGVDTMSAGNLCGLAIEASRRGLIDEDLDFGDKVGVQRFLEKLCRREGVGDLFAEGILAVEKELGLEGVAVHVKGMEPAGYDPRRSRGMGLGYVVSSRGACHARATFMKPELAGLIDIDTTEGKGAMYVDYEDRMAILDCMVFCRFYRDLLEWEYLARVVNAAVGTDYSVDDLHDVANRIVTDTHRFNERRGIGGESEHLPAWIIDNPIEHIDGEKLRISEEQMETMRRDYYTARGWGEPTA
jgi:aldehyde:ferredoxin oxidoreductase